LAKLRAMPVDTSSLDRAMQGLIPPPVRRDLKVVGWSRPLVRAMAASVAAAALLIVILLATSAGPVVASTTDMARLHDDLVSGRVPVTRVDSMQEVNAALATEWANSPAIPKVPDEHVMACCMRSVKNKRMACVLLKGAPDEPVTMTVASASDMRPPTSPTITRGGVVYHVQSSGALNMVMTERAGRCVCLIGRVSTDRLMDLAASLQF
jgi:hypothetical protein